MNGTGTPWAGTSPGKCSPVQQQGPSHHLATARAKWNKEVNKIVMECFTEVSHLMRKENPIKRYRKRTFREWRDRKMFKSTKQRVWDEARPIRRNGWLSKLELKVIKRQIEGESQSKLCREQEVTVGTEQVETDVGTVEKEVNDAEESTTDTEGDFWVKNIGLLLNY